MQLEFPESAVSERPQNVSNGRRFSASLWPFRPNGAIGRRIVNANRWRQQWKCFESVPPSAHRSGLSPDRGFRSDAFLPDRSFIVAKSAGSPTGSTRIATMFDQFSPFPREPRKPNSSLEDIAGCFAAALFFAAAVVLLASAVDTPNPADRGQPALAAASVPEPCIFQPAPTPDETVPPRFAKACAGNF
jgi:hypothetical protein